MSEIGRFKTFWGEQSPARGHAQERSPESVAMVLRNARILQGYDLKEVAQRLNIRQASLEALEENRFKDLPPLVYAQGFVGAYATFLQLDKIDLVARFREEATGAAAPLPTSPQFNLNTEPDATERRTPSKAVIIAGLLLIALLYGLWQSLVPDKRDVALLVPPLPSRFESAPVAAETPAAVEAAPVVAEPTAPMEVPPLPTPDIVHTYQGAGAIQLTAKEETWVELRNTAGERVSSLILKAGQSVTLPGNSASLILATGDIAKLSLTLDGTDVTLPFEADRTRYELTLDPTHLLNGTALLD